MIIKLKPRLTLLIVLIVLRGEFCTAQVTLNELRTDATFFIGLEKYNESFNYLQAAQKFESDKAGALIQNINIQRLVMRIRVGQPGSDANSRTSFFLRFYSVDSLTGGPGSRIFQDDVLVKNGGHSTLKIDLREYKIKVPGKAFFVAIEWILNDFNRRYYLRSRYALDDESHIAHSVHIYQPFPGMIYTGSQVSNVWVMTRQKKWKHYTHNMPDMTDLAMSVEIAY